MIQIVAEQLKNIQSRWRLWSPQNETKPPLFSASHWVSGWGFDEKVFHVLRCFSWSEFSPRRIRWRQEFQIRRVVLRWTWFLVPSSIGQLPLFQFHNFLAVRQQNRVAGVDLDRLIREDLRRDVFSILIHLFALFNTAGKKTSWEINSQKIIQLKSHLFLLLSLKNYIHITPATLILLSVHKNE